MRSIDFSSWQNLVLTLFGLIFVTLIGVGIRMLTMMTIQQRRERMNRQINERLRTLIAAYKALGGSFTGTLTVDPAHLRDLRLRASEADADTRRQDEAGSASLDPPDRPRRIRDIVEAALADILLLGTEEQVRLAGHAARELVAGRPVPTHDLVISLRNFIREALDLDPVPADLAIPAQGPARPAASGGKNGRNTQGGGRQGGGGGMGGMGMGGLGAGVGFGAAHAGTPDDSGRA
ncbi:hypothetical protein [Sphingobium fuliginis]|uniref:Uncharacterized protein n=1 Tax=Sphingobium fuliginis (strain ATCC 27551) TaxID=336203 RepID=A0A292ZBZ1_SPHSA|nr:hypothetical protein [Sphingobium fuliginis]GAY20648.1 hypothetical protein SFOMI_1178 [Sphingobium fuliginis]